MAHLVLRLLLLFLLSPAARGLSVLPAGIATQEAVQLVRPHLLSLRRFSCKPIREVPQNAYTVFYGLTEKERDRYWAGISLAPLSS